MAAPVKPAPAEAGEVGTHLTLPKCATGIAGLDEILGGGVPLGRPTLVVGGAGCGKTLLCMEFLARGILRFHEPGVFVSFEEVPADLAANFASLGFDLAAFQRDGLLRIDHVELDPTQIEETGEYDLEGLFIRLKAAVEAVGARRVVLDTIEVLFAGLRNEGVVRSELRRLFEWLKAQDITAMVTAERGLATMTRHGLEEYVADCVLLLENAVEAGIATRRLRVVKYRGSAHGANVYPFLIDADGISVLPVTSLGLSYDVSNERVSSGVERLDTLLGGGVYRGSSVLVSGTAGTGKTSIAATFTNAACGRGERVLYLAFEESAAQIVRNMRSIGLDLAPWREAGLLQIVSTRATAFGLEAHLAAVHRAIARFSPDLVVVDPISIFLGAGTRADAVAMLARLIDLMKGDGTTAVFTSLTPGGASLEETSTAVSSMMDTWILLRDVEGSGERNRVLHVLKSRGSSHSNQVRELRLTDRGIELLDVYTGTAGVTLGSARVAQEAADQAVRVARTLESARRLRERERRREALEARISALRAEFAASDEDLAIEIEDGRRRDAAIDAAEARMGTRRHADREASDGSR